MEQTHVGRALTWVLQEAADLSLERLPGLSKEAADQERLDIILLCTLALNIGADPDEIDAIARQFGA